MKIQKGIVKYNNRSDIMCTYGITDNNESYYFLGLENEYKLPNGNIIASTELVEAIDPMYRASRIGVIDENGNVVIPFVHRAIRLIEGDLLLAELATPVSNNVIEANQMRNDPTLAAKLVSTPALIKERLNNKMGGMGKYLFNDQFLEATIYDLNGNNLIDNEYYSFIAENSGKLYFSKNNVESDIREYSIFASDIQNNETSSDENSNMIDINEIQIPSAFIEGAMENTQVATPQTASEVIESPTDAVNVGELPVEVPVTVSEESTMVETENPVEVSTEAQEIEPQVDETTAISEVTEEPKSIEEVSTEVQEIEPQVEETTAISEVTEEPKSIEEVSTEETIIETPVQDPVAPVAVGETEVKEEAVQEKEEETEVKEEPVQEKEEQTEAKEEPVQEKEEETEAKEEPVQEKEEETEVKEEPVQEKEEETEVKEEPVQEEEVEEEEEEPLKLAIEEEETPDNGIDEADNDDYDVEEKVEDSTLDNLVNFSDDFAIDPLKDLAIETDYIDRSDDYDSKDYDDDSITSDVAKYMNALANQNRSLIDKNEELLNQNDKLKDVVTKALASRKSLENKTNMQDKKIEALTAKLQDALNTISELEKINREQSKTIKQQMEGRRNLREVLTNVRSILGEESSYHTDMYSMK